MMKYKVVNYTADIKTPNVQHADILETSTDQIVKRNMHVAAARSFARHLNMGGGFDGETPTFFLANIPAVDIE
jgi:hypothetical protein